MPYLQVPGPEAVQNHLPVPRLMVFGSEGSSPSSSSFWGRRGASPEPVGKESRGQGAKGSRGCKGHEILTDYSLSEKSSCQTGPACTCKPAVPRGFELGKSEDDLRLNTDYAATGGDYNLEI